MPGRRLALRRCTRNKRLNLAPADIDITPPVLLAPLAGITDLPFRTLVSRFGAGRVVSEMVASQEMVQGKTGVREKAELGFGQANTAVQLVGRDPYWLAEAARMVEAVKHGAIMDAAYFNELEREMSAILDGEAAPLERAVARSVELKSAVVSEDEREAGRREILNFGHTFGHAIEAACSFRVPHGTAVACGMILEARLGVSLGVTGPDVVERLEQVVGGVRLPMGIPDGYPGRAGAGATGRPTAAGPANSDNGLQFFDSD